MKQFAYFTRRGQGSAALLVGSIYLTACASTQPSAVNIADALAAPDGTDLVITGAVVHQIGEETVLLRDGSGQIVARIDDELLGEVRLAPDARVRIKGEVDRDEERSVVVAESIQLLP